MSAIGLNRCKTEGNFRPSQLSFLHDPKQALRNILREQLCSGVIRDTCHQWLSKVVFPNAERFIERRHEKRDGTVRIINYEEKTDIRTSSAIVLIGQHPTRR